MSQPPGRNLVVCCDGTSNEFADTKTNVVRLVQALEQHPDSQQVYYDPGVGTLPEPGLFTGAAKTVSRWIGLAFGAGLVKNVEEAYTFLMNAWRPGDRVFLFGFSRGAYTVRVLAGFLRQLGLLSPGQEQLIPYAIRLYRSTPDRDRGSEKDKSRYWRVSGEFRNTFARPIPGRSTRSFPVHFLGVWDTVSSVGWVWSPKRFAYTAENDAVARVRHAVALDERRGFFRQNLFHPVPAKADGSGQDLVERWFAGFHSDIGGGYAEERGALWRVAFDWMVDEAMAAGLRVDPARLQQLRSKPALAGEPWAEAANESLTWKWVVPEFWPKLSYSKKWRRNLPSAGLFRRRTMAGAVLHESVLRRIRHGEGYRPLNLPRDFVQQILDLPDVPPGATATVPLVTRSMLSPLAYSPALAQALGAIALARRVAGEPADALVAAPSVFVAWIAEMAPKARHPEQTEHLSLDLTDLRRFAEVLADPANVRALSAVWQRSGPTQARIELRGPPDLVMEWLPRLRDVLLASSVWETAAPAPNVSEWKWEWPFDVAVLSGAGGEAITRDIAAESKLSSWMPDLVKVQPVDHVSTADLLLLRGEPEAVADIVRATGYPPGTPLVLIQSERAESPVWVRHAMDLLARQLPHAGIGFVVVPRSRFRAWFRSLAQELTHNNPLDVALFAAKHWIHSPFTPVLRASPQLLQHARLETAMTGLVRRAQRAGRQTMAIPPQTSAAAILGEDGELAATDVADRLRAVPRDVGFASESGLATAVAEISTAAPPAPSSYRFLLATLRVRRGDRTEDASTWRGGAVNLLMVKVGVERPGWLAPERAVPFPVEEAVGDEETVEAEVTCDVEGLLEQPLRQPITLRRVGESSLCRFSIPVPKALRKLSARVTVTHAGRILQSGLYSGPVTTRASTGKARWILDTVVRSELKGLSRRRRFDVPLLLEAGSLRATNTSAGVAFTAPPIVGRILQFLDDTLSEFASDPAAYKGGLGSRSVLDPLIRLALAGSNLREELQDQHRGRFLNGRTIQVVSTTPDARLPIEILYDGDGPVLSAKLCRQAAASLRARRPKCGCGDVTSERVLCPYRFWGLSRVIERHLETAGRGEVDGDFALLPEPTDRQSELELFRGSLVAGSERVTKHVRNGITGLQKQLARIRAAGPSNVVTKWSQWTDTVRDKEPSLLLLLPHTEADGLLTSLEIQGDRLPSGNIQQKHIGKEGSKPVVMMLGCETDADPSEFLDIVGRCRRKNAVLIVVFGATIAAEDAVPAAAELIRQLDKARKLARPTLGEAMLAARQGLLAGGWVPALGLVAYGDADWTLV